MGEGHSAFFWPSDEAAAVAVDTDDDDDEEMDPRNLSMSRIGQSISRTSEPQKLTLSNLLARRPLRDPSYFLFLFFPLYSFEIVLFLFPRFGC